MARKKKSTVWQKIKFTKQTYQPKYCVFCGKPVLPFETDENGYRNPNIEWEMKHSAHWECYIKNMHKNEG